MEKISIAMQWYRGEIHDFLNKNMKKWRAQQP
jgi:hypothetical protein